MKVVINKCYGGFGLSFEAVKLYFKKKGWTFFAADRWAGESGYVDISDVGGTNILIYYFKNHIPDMSNSANLTVAESNARFELAGHWYCGDVDRSDPDLVAVVEELGYAANDRFSKLSVVEIPDDVEYYIQ
jgi:hypothetical protein